MVRQERPVPFAVPAFLVVNAENLSNRRDAVTEREFGDAQFYRMPGRRVVGTVSYGF